MILSYLKTKPGDGSAELRLFRNSNGCLDISHYIIHGIFILLPFYAHELCPCRLAFAWGKNENLSQTEWEEKERDVYGF